MAQEFALTIVALFLGLIVGRLISDQIKKAGVPIATGDIGKVPIGGGIAAGIRPAS